MSDIKKANGDAIPDGAANLYPAGDSTMFPMDDAVDSSQVKFIDGKEKEPKNKELEEFVALRKEDLAKYTTDPYWRKVRIILLVIFIMAWIAMLVASIIIIALSPSCPPRPAQEWYEKTVMYDVNVLSFQDTPTVKDDKISFNGFGDLKGLYSRLNYLTEDLKVSTLLLGPVYMSSFNHFGYDVLNYMGTCPGHYGTLQDFEMIEKALHKKGKHLVLDFIPNHTSMKHKWFNASESGEEKYKDYYVWVDGTKGTPPNDWMALDGASAWTWSDKRKQYYYHTVSSDQPDLNLRNDAVRAELEAALLYWLKMKVDGFRIIGAQYLYEPQNATGDKADFQPESIQLIAEWRMMIQKYVETLPKSRQHPRILIADVKGTAEEAVQFYGHGELKAAHVVVNKQLNELKKGTTPTQIKALIENWQNVMTPNTTNNWQLGDHTTSRVRSRYEDRDYVNAVNMLLLTLPGTAFSYYGDELGMKDSVVNATGDQIRLGAPLTPMQWNNSHNAGFTAPGATPWMSIADDYHITNRQTQSAHGSGVNHVAVYSNLVNLRHISESLMWGKLTGLSVQGDNIIMYIREAEGFPTFLVAINFGTSPSTIDFGYYSRSVLGIDDSKLADFATIVATTENFEGFRSEAFSNGTTIELNKMIYLEPKEGVVISWPPNSGIALFE